MPRNTNANMNLNDDLDIVWGAKAIAAIIGRSPVDTFYLLKNRHIPARRIGERWCASRRKLREHFLEPADSGQAMSINPKK